MRRVRYEYELLITKSFLQMNTLVILTRGYFI